MAVFGDMPGTADVSCVIWAVRERRAMRQDRIDYRMQRRAVLRSIADGARSVDDVCDAHPELLRAAAHLGRPADEACPLCAASLVYVTYLFDRDRARNPGGRAVDPDSVQARVERSGDARVYVVEVCRSCRWHHLVASYLEVSRGSGANAG